MKTIKYKTELMLEIERNHTEPLEEMLRRKFVDEHMNLYDLAQDVGISYRTLLKWLKLCGIYSRRLGL